MCILFLCFRTDSYIKQLMSTQCDLRPFHHLSSPLFWSKSLKAISSPSLTSTPILTIKALLITKLMTVMFFYVDSGPALSIQLSAGALMTRLIPSGRWIRNGQKKKTNQADPQTAATHPIHRGSSVDIMPINQWNRGMLNWGVTAAAGMFFKQRCCGGKRPFRLHEWNALVLSGIITV